MNMIVFFNSNEPQTLPPAFHRDYGCEVSPAEPKGLKLPDNVVVEEGAPSILRDHKEALRGLEKVVGYVRQIEADTPFTVTVADPEEGVLFIGIGGDLQKARQIVAEHFQAIVAALSIDECRRIGVGVRVSVG